MTQLFYVNTTSYNKEIYNYNIYWMDKSYLLAYYISMTNGLNELIT